MQRKLRVLACFFIPVAIGTANCFAQQYPFVYYTPRDGLVNSRVRSIKQDSKGRMLFITFGGLSIYDGTRFISYSRQDGLAEDLINDVVEAGPDSFLVATNSAKLNTLVRGRIGTYKMSDHFYPVINRFFKSNDGSWYVAADEGLFVLKDNRFTRLPLITREGIDRGFYLDKIIESGNYFLIVPWNNMKEKLILYDKVNKKVTDIDTKNTVINFSKDAEGRLWIATNDELRLIDTIALQRGKISFLPIPEKFRNIESSKHSFVFFDQQNNAWFYKKEIVKVSPEFRVQHITAKQGLAATSLTDFFIDREGITWIATDGDGVIKIRNTNIELRNSLDQTPISVSAIADQNDTLWFFNLANNSVCRFSENKLRSFFLSGEKLAAFNLYLNNQKLYINNGDKVFTVENKNVSSSYYHLKPIEYFKTSSNLGNGIVDKNGVIIQYVKENDTLFSLYVLKDDKLISKQPVSNFIDQMCFDRQGRLWMVVRDNRILMFTLHPEQPLHYLHLEKNYSKELPDLSPRAITIDTNNNIWVGTRYNGVYRLEFKDGQFKSATQYTTRNGLTDNFVFTLMCDSNNTVWVGTQTGLDKIFIKNGEYIIGNISKNNNFFQTVGKIMITKNNTVWAITNGGIILRISQTLSSGKAPLPPPFLFTSLQVNNRPYNDSAKDFSFRQNNLSFTVAAVSFIDEKSIKYSYLLEGSGNKAWSEPLNNSTFNFINLSPGNYTLKVRSDFPEAMYPSQMISYSFTVLPPWWQSWWFRIGIAVLGLGTLFISIRFYYRRKLEREKIILEKQQAIEKERTRIATDMHDDLGAGLSRIKFLSETIGIKKQKQLPFEEDISKIREYSHEMIDKMGEIVWALNEKNDSLSDLLSYTRSYTVEYLSQSGISCTIDSPDLLPADFVTGEFRRNIFLSVKEILHNIVKHAQANQVNITVQINHGLCINIRDDGIGFDRTKIRPYSNGLVNIEKRMKDIGGIMEIENIRGTTIKLIAPLP